MIEVLLTVLPVFLVLGAGWGATKTGWMKPETSDYLSAYAVRLAIPALLLRAMYRLDFAAAFQPPMLLGFYAGAFGAFGLAILAARLIWKRRAGEAVAVGFCALFSNTVLLGVPIVERAYGAAALTPVFGIISIHAPLLYAAGMLTMELSRRDGRPLAVAIVTAARSVIANPLMIGLLIGAVLNLLDVSMPEFLMAGISMLADSAIPAALVGLGAALARYRLKAELAESLMVSVMSLIVHPLVALAITWWILDLPTPYVQAAVIVAAMPPGMNVYIFATLYDRAVALSASSVLVATTLSVVTISFWLALLGVLLPA